MVRVEFQDDDNTTTMKVEGRLVGHFAKDVKSVVASKNISGRLIVDLSELNYVDSAGEEALLWLARIGWTFIAGNTYSSYICERLDLRMVPETVANVAAAK